ncbi:hypothetical protein [Nocardioides sp. InS609-2]|uniref:hypothetical protein n=1 Tax=Nocardioides sp. InS609-2 TaxID=2760705 RepID=UPI0017FE0173|nr:hypothetical protein [Nocardioides sp. InS609-2]MBA3780377.1 hypothetical protein [Nocardioides sp.]
MDTSTPGQDKPIDLEGVPEGEDINPTDAARRTSLDPEDQPNHPDLPHAEDPLTVDEDADDTE